MFKNEKPNVSEEMFEVVTPVDSQELDTKMANLIQTLSRWSKEAKADSGQAADVDRKSRSIFSITKKVIHFEWLKYD